MSGRPTRTRRRRTTTEALLSIVLILEAAMLFFATLTVFGLKALEPVSAFVGGGLLILATAITSGLVRWRWGVWLGWVLQAVILATGFLIPMMFVVGGGFVVLWVWCFVRARDIDRQRAAFEAQLAAEDAAADRPTSDLNTSDSTSNRQASDPHASDPNQGDRP